VRELYEQFIAYSRKYVERIPNYVEADDLFVRVSISTSTTLSAVCDAITYGSAGARAPLVAEAAPPSTPSAAENPDEAAIFLSSSNPVCPDWLNAVDEFSRDTEAWRSVDPNVPATQLDATQRDIYAAVIPVMGAFATKSQLLGIQSKNPIFSDFATLSAQYRRAYSAALLTYAPADNYLQIAAGSAAGAISGACRAAGE
jgi:hypothetical protein